MVRHRPKGSASTLGSAPTGPSLGCFGKDRGKQFAWHRARDLGRDRRSSRRPEDQIGLSYVQPGIKQTGDDTDLPRITGRSTTSEDQRPLSRVVCPPRRIDLQHLYPNISSANARKFPTTALSLPLLSANPTSDMGMSSAISHPTTAATLCFTADRGSIEIPIPAATSEISVGISPADCRTFGTMPAWRNMPKMRS